jgi:PAS domain S-box-containing protein
MPAAASFTNAEWAQQLAAERARCLQAEADLVAAQVRIAALEQHQAELAAENSNPVLQLDDAGEIRYANPAAASLLATALGLKPLRALAHEARHQRPAPRELAVGPSRYLVATAMVPGQADIILCLKELAPRPQANQQARDQQGGYEVVLEHLSTMVAVFDHQHRYVFLNAMVEPDPSVRAWMLGKTSEEACLRRGRPVAIAQQRNQAFAQALREQREVTWEEVHEHPSGPRHLLVRYQPVLSPSGAQWVISSGVDMTARQLAEQQVQQQQEFYESILNLLPFDVAVFDAGHRFLFVNPAAVADPVVRQEVLGHTNAEYFAWRQLKHPELAQQREQYFDLAVRTRKDVTWEEMRTDRQGRPQLMVRHLRPVFGPDGALRLVVGSGIDITARYMAEKLQQQVQEMLREQEAFIRQIVDALPNVLYLVEGEGQISFSNRMFDERIANSDHMNPAPQNPVVAQEVLAMRAFNRDVLLSGQPAAREMPLTQLNGERLHYQVYKQPLRRASGNVGVLTISTDITEVKRARQALERREKQYHDLVYYSQALICTHDLAGTLLSVNPAIEALLGWPAAELVGRPLASVLSHGHLADLRDYLTAIGAQQSQDRLMRVCTRAGEWRYLHCYAYPVVEPGQAPYVVASGYDVTAGVLAQRGLRQAMQQAEENARAKEDFLARMSHEIRTPLNGVLGMAALLQKTPLSEQQADYLHTMQHAGRHLLALVNDVLDMAKITAQHLQLNQQPFNLTEVLQAAGQAVAALAGAKGLELVVRPLPAGLPHVVGDAYRLQQVLLNLLSNAIKFTEQGRVELGAEIVAETPTVLRLRFWVTDTGIGIEPAVQARIFEAFAQASADTSQRFGGTGLGLAISRQLVEQMEGTLALCSTPGAGSTFSFQLSLPCAAAPLGAAAAAPPLPTFENLRGLRVLLAEDNPVNQQIAVAVLEHWGVQVQAVGNGRDALAYLQEQDYDAAILDIRMPGLTGVEVTTAIRAGAHPRHAGIPIIALTANAFEADRVAYLNAGMNACLVKPYEETDLCQLLLNLTEK